MTTGTCDHEPFSPLDIDNEVTAAEFKLATHQALRNMQSVFLFHGFTIEIDEAIEIINDFEDGRTYH